MKMHYYLLAATLISLPAVAQETYENAKLTGFDLNGTARYVGMGGAMEALGADISTIGSNPAGIGLFRRSQVTVSGGLLMQHKGKEFADGKKTNASFDQIGFVYSTRARNNSNMNFGFNYTKGKNFDYILNASNKLGHGSQNNQSFIKNVIGNDAQGGFNVRNNGKENIGYQNSRSNDVAWTWNQLDYLYFNTLLPDATQKNTYKSYLADEFIFDRANTGYIGNYDFNVSGSIQDKVYLGVTFGLKDVHYDGQSQYDEKLANNLGGVLSQDIRTITGTGFDITAGVIVRPIYDSPFRFGAYVKTPTWYDLRTENVSRVDVDANINATNTWGEVKNAYEFKIWTPWKFGFSLGHTIGNYLALGLTYEYEDHSTINTRVNNGVYYDYYGDAVETTTADYAMNKHTEQTLKGVSTLKLGAEYKPVSNFALRVGYNYVSSKYDKNAQKDPSVPSYGTNYQSTTDFVNWDAINRFTAGVGYQVKNWNIDLAYQYSAQKGDFYPFSNMAVVDKATKTTYSNTSTATKIDNNRSQLLLTLGYKF